MPQNQNLTKKQMVEIIERGGSVSFNNRIFSKVSELPSEQEIKIFYDKQNKQIDYAALFSKFVRNGGVVSIPAPQPQLPVVFAPATDEKLAEEFPYTEELGLGRIPQMVDVRDALFPMESALVGAEKVIKEVRMRYWQTAKAMDQGTTSQCVAYSGTQLLLSAPVKNPAYKTPYEFYKECQRVDEWIGENYEGTSVRAMCKVLKTAGYIGSYVWASDVETVVKHVLGVGPVVLGTNWYNSMFYPDAITGFIRIEPKTGVAGGHAYMIKGANRDKLCPDGSKGAFRIINSWGTEWGQDGMAFISFKDVARLIKEYGEAAAVTELKFNSEANK